MDSKDIKDLLVINLTAVIALATSPLLPKIGNDTSQIDPIALAYWVNIALILVGYAIVSVNDKRQDQEPHHFSNREYNYCIALEVNLACIGMVIASLVLCNGYHVASDYISLPLAIVFIIEAILVGYYPIKDSFNFEFVNNIISHYHDIKDIIANPIMLVGAAIWFYIGFILLNPL